VRHRLLGQQRPQPRAHLDELVHRLDVARHRLRDGTPLAEVALTAGFADQAHFTRMFASADGLTPGRYARLHIPEAAPTARAPDGSVRRRWLRARAR
jgi:AraC-like DNA-binding protein